MHWMESCEENLYQQRSSVSTEGIKCKCVIISAFKECIKMEASSLPEKYFFLKIDFSVHTHTQFLVCWQSKNRQNILIYWIPLTLFSLSSFHPTSLNFLIAGHVKNQQWRLRLRQPAAAVIETVMRRGSVCAGRVKDSGTHRQGERRQSRCVDEVKTGSDGKQERENEGRRVWSRQETADRGVCGSRSLPGKALK